MHYVIVVIFKDGVDRSSSSIYRKTDRGWETDANGGQQYPDVNLAFRDSARFSETFSGVEYVVEERQ